MCELQELIGISSTAHLMAPWAFSGPVQSHVGTCFGSSPSLVICSLGLPLSIKASPVPFGAVNAHLGGEIA